MVMRMANVKWKMANGAESARRARHFHFPFAIFHLPWRTRHGTDYFFFGAAAPLAAPAAGAAPLAAAAPLPAAAPLAAPAAGAAPLAPFAAPAAPGTAAPGTAATAPSAASS